MRIGVDGRVLFGGLALATAGLLVSCSSADPPLPSPPPAAATTSSFAELAGGVHHLARPQFEIGRTDPKTKLESVTLAFRLGAAQMADQVALLARLRDPSSPDYHRWLTPEEYAARFGASEADQARVRSWLSAEGFTVTRVARAGTHLYFDGTVGQVEHAFRTEMHDYVVNGQQSFGLAVRPSVPSELAPLVLALRGTHTFKSRPRPLSLVKMADDAGHPTPAYTAGSTHALSPADFATIYDVNPLYTAAPAIDGTGITIGVAGRSAIVDADTTSFRNTFGLPAKAVTKVLVPGTGNATNLGQTEYEEASLDVQWAGAVAKNANVVFTYVGNNPNTDDVFTSMQYMLDARLADVMSVSMGECEGDFAGSEGEWLQFGDQAALEGISVVAASGDAGAAGCDLSDTPPATHGLAVVLPAAAPGVTAVGGTGFNEGAGSYWNPTNSASLESAKSYIPEVAWNDCDPTASSPCTDMFASTGGGLSALFSKPYWQTGTGVPNDGARDVPDVALAASTGHDSILVRLSADGIPAGFYGVGGTSAGTPAFASVLALVNQALLASGKIPRSGLGNVNPTLYTLAANVPAAFHDVVTGDNKVPCQLGSADCPAGSRVMGYPAQAGYDLTTGVGSVDVNNLVTAWKALAPTSIAVLVAPSAQVLGQPVSLDATVTSPAAAQVPTGQVEFYDEVGHSLGVSAVTGTPGQGTASLSVSTLTIGAHQLFAAYSGDKNFDNSFTVADVSVYSLDAGCDAGVCDATFGPSQEDGGAPVFIVDNAGTDAGVEAGLDAATDAATDAGGATEAGFDGGSETDAAADAGFDAGTDSESNGVVDSGVDTAASSDSGTSVDAGTSIDSGTSVDAGTSIDSGTSIDAGTSIDSGTSVDAGTSIDSGTSIDAGTSADSAMGSDSQVVAESGTATDAGTGTDAGREAASGMDASGARDATAADSNAGADSGVRAQDAGAEANVELPNADVSNDSGCGCRVAGASGTTSANAFAIPGVLGALLFLGVRRRRRASTV